MTKRRHGRWNRADLLAWSPTFLLILVAPQLMGGVTGLGILTISIGAAIAAGAASTVASDTVTVPRAPLLVFGGLALWTCLQAVPVPVSFVPRNAAEIGLVSAGLRVVEREASGYSITLDPGATLAEIAKLACYFAAFTLGCVVGSRDRLRAVAAVVVACTLMSVVALAHAVFRVDAVFGLAQPVFRPSGLVAPLLNPNHLGGFAAMGVPAALGIALSSDRQRDRVLAGTAAVICGSVALLSGSRGAVASLVLGVGLVAFRRSVTARGGPGWGVQVFALLGTIIVFLAFGGTAVLEQILGTDLSKVDLALRSVDLLSSRPILGIGRGAFSTGFVMLEGTTRRFTHAENLPIQLLVEWGSAAGLVALGGLGALLVGGYRRAVTPLRIGGWAAFASILAHELADFATELAGVGFVVSFLAGSVAAHRTVERGLGARTTLRLAAGAGCVAALAVARPVWGGVLLAHDIQLSREVLASPASVVESRLVDAIMMHPLEPALYVHLAAVRLKAGRSPLSAANQAMRLAPGWAEPHLIAARWLVPSRGDQALLEVRAAADLEPQRAARFLCDLHLASVDQVERSAPRRGSARDAFLVALGDCLPPESEAARVADELLVEAGSAPAQVYVRFARRCLADSNSECAMRHAESAAARSAPGDRAQAIVILAEALVASGNATDALAALQRGIEESPQSWEVLEALATIHASLGHVDAMRSALDRLDRLAAGRTTQLAASARIAASMEERAGDLPRALAALERAQRLSSDRATERRILRIASRLGLDARAERSLRTLCSRYADDDACRRCVSCR